MAEFDLDLDEFNEEDLNEYNTESNNIEKENQIINQDEKLSVEEKNMKIEQNTIKRVQISTDFMKKMKFTDPQKTIEFQNDIDTFQDDPEMKIDENSTPEQMKRAMEKMNDQYKTLSSYTESLGKKFKSDFEKATGQSVEKIQGMEKLKSDYKQLENDIKNGTASKEDIKRIKNQIEDISKKIDDIMEEKTTGGKEGVESKSKKWEVIKLLIILSSLGALIGFLVVFLPNQYSGCYQYRTGKGKTLLGSCGYKDIDKYNCSCDGSWSADSKKANRALSVDCKGDNVNYPPCKCGISSLPLCTDDITSDNAVSYRWNDENFIASLGDATHDIANDIFNATGLNQLFATIGKYAKIIFYVIIGLIITLVLLKFLITEFSKNRQEEHEK